MAPRGAIWWLVWAVGDGCSKRLVGIELGRRPIGHELFAPGLLHLGAVGVPQCMAQWAPRQKRRQQQRTLQIDLGHERAVI